MSGSREYASAESRAEPFQAAGSRHRARSFLWPALSIGVIALSSFWLYQRALTFAYFNDDPSGHFAWMEGKTLWEFFAGSAEYGYYRPVVFSTLRVTEHLFGTETFPHHPVADHALLVLLHSANAALVWLLAYRLSRRSMAYAWIAAGVFAFTPFSYEAVAYVASLTHPLHVFWLLSALLLFDRGRRNADRRFLFLGGFAQLVALFSHENGLFILPALVGVDWVVRPQVPWRERVRWLWPYAVMTGLFFFVWLLVPKNSEQGLNGVVEIGRNTLPFIQTLVFPLLPFIRPDAGSLWMPVIMAGLVIGGAGWLARRLGAWRLWVFGVGWVALAALPSLLFLGPAYVYGSPRLSYLPSIGVALLWAMPGLLVRKKTKADSADSQESNSSDREIPVDRGAASVLVAIALVGAFIAVLIVPAVSFIRCQLDFYDETSRIARRMATVGRSTPENSDVMFVNLPFFFSSTSRRPDGCPNPYPWTPTGGILIPPYAQPRDFVRFNGGPDRSVEGVRFGMLNPAWQTFGPEISGDQLRDAVGRGSVIVFDLLADDFGALSTAWHPGGSPASTFASFGGVLELTSAGLNQMEESLNVELDWRVAGLSPMPLSALVHVYDSAGPLVAQADGPPGSGLVPQTLWQVDDGLRDIRQIDISSLPAGRYTIAAGVYSQLDGLRLPAVKEGLRLDDDVYVIGTFER